VTSFSNSAWANRKWKPSQNEEANWLREMEPAKASCDTRNRS